MSIIDSAEALRIIKDVGITHVMEVDSLNYLVNCGDYVCCLKNDDLLVTINKKDRTNFLM